MNAGYRNQETVPRSVPAISARRVSFEVAIFNSGLEAQQILCRWLTGLLI
jgi:hypothetical protein